MRSIDKNYHNRVCTDKDTCIIDERKGTMTYLPDPRVDDTFILDELIMLLEDRLKRFVRRSEYGDGYRTGLSEALSYLSYLELLRDGGVRDLPLTR